MPNDLNSLLKTPSPMPVPDFPPSSDQQNPSSNPYSQTDSNDNNESPLVIPVPPQSSSRVKIIVASLALFFILASIPAALYLTQQKQELRKEATTTTLECYADKNGVKIVNHTGQDVTGDITWLAKWCGGTQPTSCFCPGTSSSEKGITIKNGQTWTHNMTNETPPTNCAWQSDIAFSGNVSCSQSGSGCEGECGQTTITPTSKSTPPQTQNTSSILDCVQIQVLRNNVVINTNLLKFGDQVVFRGFANTYDSTDSIDKIEFTIRLENNLMTGFPISVATTKVGNYWQADLAFNISETGTYKVVTRIHSVKYGWSI